MKKREKIRERESKRKIGRRKKRENGEKKNERERGREIELMSQRARLRE